MFKKMNDKQLPIKEEKGKSLVRKPSIKNKKPPEIRQTLTSKYRMLKANPLLMMEMEKAVTNNNDTQSLLKTNQSLKTLANAFPSNSVKIQPTKKLVNHSNNHLQPNKIEIYPKPKPNSIATNTNKTIDFTHGNFLSSTVIENKKESVLKKQQSGLKQHQTKTNSSTKTQSVVEKNKKTVRRSLSADNFDLKTSLINQVPRFKKSESLEQVKYNPSKNTKLTVAITEESDFNFKTPTRLSTQIMKRTPQSTNNRRSLFLSTPNPDELSKRLNDWLKKRGKSLGDYHHLKCFGVHDKREKSVIDENKENVEINPGPGSSYEDLAIPVIIKPPENNENLENVAREALQDLHKLILDGYPNQQCEIWLKLIKDKYNQLEEEPQYWECRAALEQAKGNISMAVEFFKTAIIQGADVTTVDKSLDQLLQKFSLLNINNGTPHNDRARIVQDARNVFKSSIIQFAVQERILKKNKKGENVEKKFIATPVRRSTRLSRTRFTSTPGVQIYSTLQEAKEATNISFQFQCNKALKD